MKVINESYTYELENFINKEVKGQVIQFLEKKPDPENPEQLITVCDGTTHEELIEVVIHRLKELNKNFPCKENTYSINHLDKALMWQEERSRKREKLGIIGKHIL